MSIILFESVSLNGMIGRPNGVGDFFTNYCWTGFVDIARETGAMIWGRTTHDGFGAAMRDAAPELRGVVLTRNRDYEPGPNWSIAESPEAAVRLLHAEGVEHALVVGGQSVNTAFAKAGLLDEIMLFVEAVTVSTGMPLFSGELPDMRLRLLDVARPTDTVLRLHYSVLSNR